MIGAELGLAVSAAKDVFNVPENIWKAVTLARNVRLQSESDAIDRASGKPVPMRGYNEDAEEYSGRP